MRVAVVSRPLPPAPSGQAMMLYRLFKGVSPEDYRLISTVNYLASAESESRRLPGKYFHISDAHELRRGYRFGLAILREAFNVSLGAYIRARQIARIIRQEKCEAVLSCSSGDDVVDVPSGFIASRLARVPFYIYLFDTYSHMWFHPHTKFLGRLIEVFILKRSANIIVTNESAKKLLDDRYGVNATVIHNPCDISEYRGHSDEETAKDDGVVRVVYTGAIYEAHYDALRNLLAAIEQLGHPRLELHLYTSYSPSALAKQGIRGPVVFHDHQPASAIPEIHRQADLLFLPLAFTSPYPELVRISSPSKIGEFLAAGRPILVHAPANSFIATYFHEHQCGLVVDHDDPKLLAQGLERLLSDANLRRRLCANALERAVVDFSLPAATAKLAALFQLNIPSHSQG
jgi:glycosyltransferase involved in cell wall biosynthesis